mmetsp:Transcript_25819/g.39052  ORF Transcript_25819/g.39052 Transcript_25819/m.39052 type:complete len:118 (+) Transcript_25819:26-379(+)
MYVVIFWKHAALARTWIVLAMASVFFIWKSSKDFQFSTPNDLQFSSLATKEPNLKARKPKAKLANLSSPLTSKTFQRQDRRSYLYVTSLGGTSMAMVFSRTNSVLLMSTHQQVKIGT